MSARTTSVVLVAVIALLVLSTQVCLQDDADPCPPVASRNGIADDDAPTQETSAVDDPTGIARTAR